MRRFAAILAVAAIVTMLSDDAFAQAKQPGPGKQNPTLERLRKVIIAGEKIARTLPQSQRTGPSRYAEYRLTLHKLELAARRDKRGRVSNDVLLKAAREGEKRLKLLTENEDAKKPRKGFQERAYIAETDGSIQPYFLHVPQTYKPDKAMPLLIFLHGYHSELDASTWEYLMLSPSLVEFCEDNGVILLMPFGRGNTEFMGPGEDDVLRTIRFVKKEYSIDEDRVILTGSSMGGSGALAIASHQPHLFAAVLLITARVDYYLWQGIKPTDLPLYKRLAIDRDYGLYLLPNLMHIPIQSYHGELDGEFATQAARLKELAKANGVTAKFVEFPDEGHQIWEPSFTHATWKKLALSARRPKAPKKVALRTYTMKYPRAYWVKIDGISRYDRGVEVDATVEKDGSLSIMTKNATGLVLGPGIPGIVPGRKFAAKVNGKARSLRADSNGIVKIELERAPPAKSKLRKSAAMPGMFRDVFTDPFIVVYPGGKDRAVQEFRKRAGSFVGDWFRYAHGMAPYLEDARVPPRMLLASNLILIGTPEANSTMKKFSGKLPVRVEGGFYHVGERKIPTKGNGIYCLYPNPVEPKRYLAIVDGVPYGPKLQMNHKFDFLPDFLIFRKDTKEDNTWFPTNEVLVAGYFDGNWQLSKDSTWFNEEAIARLAQDAPKKP
jgi:pimeloyl-ACP methyl ester carboxylesterase